MLLVWKKLATSQPKKSLKIIGKKVDTHGFFPYIYINKKIKRYEKNK